MHSKVLISLIVVTVAVIAPALALQCYSCSSHDDPECENPSVGTPSQICPADYKFCRKVEQEINIDGEDTHRVWRGCAKTAVMENLNDECLERTGTYRFKSWYCECNNEDKCNSATGSQVSMLVMSLSAGFGFLVKKLL